MYSLGTLILVAIVSLLVGGFGGSLFMAIACMGKDDVLDGEAP